MNFVELQTESVVGLALLKKAVAADNWVPNNGIERIELSVADFAGDAKMVALIEHFKCKEQRKLSIFRFKPFTCHAWHVDLQRFAAINMLLQGWDSLTMFGKRVDAVNFEGIEKLVYKPDRYYLLNSKRQHTITNFSETRYLVSIGIPEEFSFMDVVQYIQREGT